MGLAQGKLKLQRTSVCLSYHNANHLPLVASAGETKNFENAFKVNTVDLSGLPLAFYSGMYAYAGW